MSGRHSPLPVSIVHPRLLLGEGREEERFFASLLAHLQITNVQVASYGGKDNLAPYLRTLANTPGFAQMQTLVITRDADANPSGAAQSVASSIRSAAFPDSLKIRSFILPSPSSAGALEDLCLASLAGTSLDNCCEEFFACAARVSDRSFETNAIRAKARIHAWLAAQNPPDLRLGQAAEKGLVDWSAPAFLPLKTFLAEALR